MSDCRFGVSPVNYPDPDPVQFSRNFAVSISPRKLKSAKYFPIFENLVLKNYLLIKSFFFSFLVFRRVPQYIFNNLEPFISRECGKWEILETSNHLTIHKQNMSHDMTKPTK